MWIYILFFLVAFMAFCGGGKENRSKVFLMIYTGALALFVGCSDMLGGYDRYIYAELFDSMANDINFGLPMTSSYAFAFYEVGYSFIAWMCAHITENRYIYILIVTLLIYFNIYKTFERHATNYPFAFIVFFGMMFFFTFTYLRQVIGVSVAWLRIRYLLDRKRVMFFAMMIVVALIHKSGIVFAAMYFIPIRKYSKGFVILALLACAVVGMSGFTATLYDVYMESRDELEFMGSNLGYQTGYSEIQGSRIAYLLEVLFFAGLILLNYDKIKPTRENMIFLNMAWCFCALLLLFIRSENGGRMAWLFAFGIIYIVTLIATAKNESSSAVSPIGLMASVVFFALYLRILIFWGVTLAPYKTFFSNGSRQGDFIYEQYEYDHRYDEDKFYRPAFRFISKTDDY